MMLVQPKVNLHTIMDLTEIYVIHRKNKEKYGKNKLNQKLVLQNLRAMIKPDVSFAINSNNYL